MCARVLSVVAPRCADGGTDGVAAARAPQALAHAQVMRRYHITERDDYKKYNKICGMVTKLTNVLRQMEPTDPLRIDLTDQLLEKCVPAHILGAAGGQPAASCQAAGQPCARKGRSDHGRQSQNARALHLLLLQAVQHGRAAHQEEPGAVREARHRRLLPAAPVGGHGAAQDGRDAARGVHLHRAGQQDCAWSA